ncbi:Aspartic proteinase CDR1 [Linum perenne]
MVLLCFTDNSEAAAGGGFSVQLIHRDSPVSPFYNPHLSPSQRLGNALKRSVNCLHHFSSTTTNTILSAQSQVTPDNGEYLMNISLGTPPVQILAIADTGSDNIWTQCKPCTNCYVHNAPLFDPASSSTYKTVPCSSKTLVGCSHNNVGKFPPNGSGIVGLGGGSASLVSQIGSSIGYKFSYCLAKFGEDKLTSTMNFGENAVVSGVSTPLISHPTAPTFYFLDLVGVSVGESRIPLQTGSSLKGNIIIDSGTTLTMLPTEFFSQLSNAVESQIIGGKKAEDPQGDLSLCYVRLTCLAFQGSDNGSIYGNVAQQNFLIGYDIQKRTVSFKPTDCARNN